jgi:hypothetical protein
VKCPANSRLTAPCDAAQKIFEISWASPGRKTPASIQAATAAAEASKAVSATARASALGRYSGTACSNITR